MGQVEYQFKHSEFWNVVQKWLDKTTWNLKLWLVFTNAINGCMINSGVKFLRHQTAWVCTSHLQTSSKLLPTRVYSGVVCKYDNAVVPDGWPQSHSLLVINQASGHRFSGHAKCMQTPGHQTHVWFLSRLLLQSWKQTIQCLNH